MTRPLRFRHSARLALVPLIALAMAMPAVAPAQDAGSQGTFSLPENPVIFGKNDPNHRTAKVIINGEVITGTDVDQRVALIVAASGGKIAADE